MTQSQSEASVENHHQSFISASVLSKRRFLRRLPNYPNIHTSGNTHRLRSRLFVVDMQTIAQSREARFAVLRRSNLDVDIVMRLDPPAASARNEHLHQAGLQATV